MKTVRPARSKGAFATFGLGDDLLRAISDAGFREPRPIQTRTIPAVLEGRDVLGLAQTGTGKTAAFALPIIERLMASRGENARGRNGRRRGPRGLILAPTRELALQIHNEIQLLGKYTGVRSVTVFGGVSAAAQVRGLRARPDLVVACPGRLLDLMGSGDARLDDIEVLVLDEADHMLDMGFLPDIKRILKCLPRNRQNLLFSATMPKEIRSLTDHMLHDPHVAELAHSAPVATVEHALYPVDQKRKTALLRHLMSADDFESAIVFLRTKHRTRRLAEDLDRAGHRAIALQGNMNQSQRLRAMQGFRDGRYDVLVATDIAARGIDVAKVSHVINFDIPDTPDAYTHRIGRTGRSECTGKAYTFVTHEDFPTIKTIERTLKLEIPRVKLREFRGEGDREAADRRESGGDRRNGKSRPARPGYSAKRGKVGRSGARPRPAAGGSSNGTRSTSAPAGEKAASGTGASTRRPPTKNRKRRGRQYGAAKRS